MIVRKQYKRSDLLISDSELRRRIRTIEQVSKSTPYPTKFQLQDDYITRYLPMGPRDRLGYDSVPINGLLAIAETLDKAFQIGLVHGDIHWKNIIDSECPTLVDWEPALSQVKHERSVSMVTYPWIDPLDRTENIISSRTDLMCFAGLLGWKKVSYFSTSNWRILADNALRVRRPFTWILKSTKLLGALKNVR